MNKKLLCVITITITLALLGAIPAFGGDEEKPKLQRLSVKQLSALENSADTARASFFSGDYAAAEEAFQSLAVDFNASQPLYKCELAAVCLASGNEEEAANTLLEAYTALEGFIDPKLERSAAGIWGSETKKIYRGDPYEQSSLCLLLGLTFLENGDVDNALACFKTGQLADSDVTNELYTSDFGLLQALEAKCYRLRNQPIEHDELAELALESYMLTHPVVRDLVSHKQSLLNQAKEKPRNADELRESLEEVEKSISKATGKVDVDYTSPLFEDWNTLVIIWSGKSPEMVRVGEYGEKRVIVKRPSLENRYEVLLDETQWHDAVQGFADFTFQATTRGGRVMDDVLANQAQVKDFTSDMGGSLMDMADDVGGEAGLVLFAVGLFAKGVSAAMKVEADVRCWQTLPDTFQVVPMNLAPGEHRLDIACYDQYIKTRSINTRIRVENQPVNVSFVHIPTL